MKKPILILFCLFSLFASQVAVSQLRLFKTGLYLIDNDSKYRLSFNNKTYGVATEPVCSIGEFKSTSTSKMFVNGKEIYSLNMELNREGAMSLAKVQIDYAKKKYLGLIVNGKLESVAWLTNPLENGKVSMTGSKPSLEGIQKELKSEMK